MTSIFREPMNGLTHCVGAVLALIGTVLLIVRSVDPFLPWHMGSFIVFGVCMVLLYTTSTLYHWLRLSEAGQRLWRRLDHCMIFVYIAATYTPICLVAMRGSGGWPLFAAVWSVAVLGVLGKCFWLQAPRWVSTGLYMAMGWMVILGIKPLVASLPVGALWWLVAGGAFYTLGAVIYALKRPALGRVIGFHELFHVFVMIGSFCHFMVMYLYVAHL